jgi:hypothetical protein
VCVCVCVCVCTTKQSYGRAKLIGVSSKDWSFGLRREITFPMFGDGIFTQDGNTVSYPPLRKLSSLEN